ncbi:DUF1501 domain-containing protein [filamentous cyanobacterium LEGE 11480]|uniref:DUF1501 domain-containing protein n=1 Tax=Romeriopsis navalis LEGE 11480 TaxID=2777977 RepID=A0A928VM01_9CYAN|nr:DUF1501 domain-containing protein [Romeriopsis navalis]MBE9031011.1 DUF1501 domain-containing protein [Romeriopsis navalis LEGE 11480]
MQRRQFLQGLALGSAGLMLPVLQRSWISRSEAATDRAMVVVMLRGAVDGLSVLVPYGDDVYEESRPTIAIPAPGMPGGVTDLDGYFGLHPALAKLLPLWSAGKLAFVPASGSPDGTRSHFDAQDYLESGTPGVKNTRDGWLNRLLAEVRQQNPIQAVSISSTTPRILAGAQSIASVAPGKRATRKLALDRAFVAESFAELYAGRGKIGAIYQEGRQAREAIMAGLNQEMQKADNGATSVAGLAGDARRLGQLMQRDRRVQLGFMQVGGWDTHINQGAAKGQLANKLRLLSSGLVALSDALGSRFNQTVIVVMSEFGRTVKENGNRGTDHGRGNVMWVLGGGVKGKKIYGKWPGLDRSTLEAGRDVPVVTDFRDVLQPILTQHWGLSDVQLARVLPDYGSKNSISGLLK